MENNTPKTIYDGCTAAAYVAYALSEVATVYPITPIASMGETADMWAYKGVKNVFGGKMEVREMESELGAAGATHGALCGGALATTFTSSQGLMLMIPNMYKIAGELLPAVFHVGCRSLATHALSIFGDHQDAMACRATGFAFLVSSSVQETHDLGIVAHLAAIEGSVPFMHMFDGFRTSNEMSSIDILPYDKIAPMVNQEKVEEFKRRAMNPEHPDTRGTSQDPDVYFQNTEVSNIYYNNLPAIVEKYMKMVGEATGRQYHLFDYVGAPDAEYVTVSLGSSNEVAETAVEWLNKHGYKVGHIKVRLYRPWVAEAFLAVLPKTAKVITALDRTKEPGSLGEPLFLDVATTIQESGMPIKVYGGRYGLASKDFNPAMLKAIYDNMMSAYPKKRFTVGINDDVTHLSLNVGPNFDPLAGTAKQSIFYGIGADGTVGATKQAAKIINDKTNLYSQAYFSYSAKKSGGYTISELRFDSTPIKAEYRIEQADYVGCHKAMYVDRYDMLSNIKEGGIFVINCKWNRSELETKLPATLRREIAEKKLRLYTIDAEAVAIKNGLGQRINMIMEAVWFHLLNILPDTEAISALKESIATTYSHEGEDVVQANYAAIDDALSQLQFIEGTDTWVNATDSATTGYSFDTNADPSEPEWVKRIARPMLRLEGDKLPVSMMPRGGVVPNGTTQYENRCIAQLVPVWDPDKCIECAQCSFVCSHAAIRPYVATDDELKDAPTEFVTKPTKLPALKGLHWRIQTYPSGCTGCASCATVCPGHALSMQPIDAELIKQKPLIAFAENKIAPKETLLPRNTIQGSQLWKPLLEFSGACGGCGETPYVKLLTQLMGERIVIANATGCSSIWGGSMPSQPYTMNRHGHGPAWGNSLFEDNAEYGYGITTAINYNREMLIEEVQTLISNQDTPADLKSLLEAWAAVKNDYEKSAEAGENIKKWLSDNPTAKTYDTLRNHADLLGRKSVWAIGGDGWAFDIGFAGLDHVLASGLNINILVMDTECYSNTGGQTSKATPYAACTKYSYAGKRTFKKDLGKMMQTYGNVYVASVSMGANMMQTIKALQEAEAYEGPSIVICYCPCINQGIKKGMSHSIPEEKEAVKTGLWQLYRFNPATTPAMAVDSLAGENAPVLPFLMGENRFAVLPMRVGTSTSNQLFASLQSHIDKDKGKDK